MRYSGVVALMAAGTVPHYHDEGYKNDIGDYMEWSADGFWPVNVTNDACRLAINYVMYGMAH